MIEGVGTSMHAQWLRHEVLANNLANASTAGFKQDEVAFPTPAWTPSLVTRGLVPLPLRTGPLVDLVGWTDFSQGAIRPTGRNLDVALSGPGFLVVDTPAGPRYTRSGALDVTRDGTLVLPGAGPVLGERGPLTVRSTDVTIGRDGEVRDAGRPVGRLRVVDFDAPGAIRKEGASLFAPVDPRAEPGAAQGVDVVGGALENANVNAVGTMVAMIELHRLYEACQRVVQAADETDAKAVNEIGRVG
jgi:flagellar basal body rod protein FlgG